MLTRPEIIGGSSTIIAATPASIRAVKDAKPESNDIIAAAIEIPWYESYEWLSLMAACFGIIAVLSIIHKIILMRRDIQLIENEEKREKVKASL